MRILVLSDSHSSLDYMRRCVEKLSPDCILHLGDHYDDGEVIRDENPGILFYQVPGNCDTYRCPPDTSEVLVVNIGGVWFYLTHGHRHMVKSTLYRLVESARQSKVDAVLYGHTHMEDCHWEEDGLLVMNPGSCGYFGGKAGLIVVENQKIKSCRILSRGDLEEMV